MASPAPSADHKSAEQNTTKRILIAAAVLIVVVVVIWLLFREKSTVIVKQSGDDVKATSLTCETQKLADGAAIIDYQGAIASEYTVEAIFHDDSLYNMSIYATLTYATAAEAEGVAPYLEADLNYYISDHDMQTDYYLYETWSVVDNKISLTANVTEDKYTTSSAPFFLIDNIENSDGTQAAPTSRSAIKSNYQKKGFTCTEND